MKEALLHIQNAINVLRRHNAPSGAVSVLEGVHASLMRDIFPASARDHWTLGFDEPRPHANHGICVMEDPRYQHGLSK